MQQLGADQHRVEPAHEEEQPDPAEVLDPHDLVVGAEPEVAADPLLLLLAQRRRAPEQARDGVVGEAEPDEEADHAEQVGEQQRDVVFVDVVGVFEAFRVGDQVADPPAEVVAADAEYDRGEEVEPDQAPPQRTGRPLGRGARGRGAHSPLLERFGGVRRRVLRELLGHRREEAPLFGDPPFESRAADDVTVVEHAAVPDAAELGAVDFEGLDLRRLDEGDVVDVGVRVGLHPELVGPEGVDHVERGDVQFDHRVHRQLEVGRLDPAVGRVAVGERPLLRDHLHGQLRPGGLRQRRRAVPRAGAVALLEADGPVHGEREHQHGRRDDPEGLQARVPAQGRPFQCAPGRLAERDHRVDQVDDDEQQHRRRHREQDGVVGHLAGGGVAAVAGREVRAEQDRDQRRRDQRRDDPDRQEAAQMVGARLRRRAAGRLPGAR